MRVWVRGVLLLVLLAWGLVLARAPEPIWIGTTTDEPSALLKDYLPLARSLEAALGLPVRVIFPQDLTEARALIERGQLDVYVDSVYPVLALGLTPILVRFKGGVASYRSLVVVGSQSSIADLSALSGKRVGFEEPWSTSGYLVPALALEAAGLRLVALDSLKAPVPPGAVGYVFTYDDENTLFWLKRGWIDAGAISDQALRALTKGRAAGLSVIYQSEPIPRHLVAVRPGLDPGIVRRLKAALLKMNDDPEGRRVLLRFGQTTRFRPLDQTAERFLEELKRRLP